MFAHTFDVRVTVRSHLMEPNEVPKSVIIAALRSYAYDLEDMTEAEFDENIQHHNSHPCL